MFGTTVFGLDTGAWLADHHRSATVLVESATRTASTTPDRIQSAVDDGCCGHGGCCC